MKTVQVSINKSSSCKPRLARLSLLIGAMFSGSLAHSGITDISSTPIANTSDISAKPNIMYIIDDSGSMAWSFMPDDLGKTSKTSTQNPTDANAFARYGGLSSQCNGVAYNPNFNYSANLPLQADGTAYPHASFTAVLDDGFQMNLSSAKSSTTSVAMATGDLVFKLSGSPSFSTTAGTVIGVVRPTDSTQWMLGTIKSWNSSTLQLTITVTKFVGSGTYASWNIGNPNTTSLEGAVYYKYKGTQPALSWTFTQAGYIDTTFTGECMTATSTSSTVFTKVTLTSTATEAQNYADWYAYYRKRFLMMRTVSGQALNSLDSKYRVGFTTISNSGVGSSSTFLDISDFDSTQKASFYSKVYNADVGGSTPLRAALSKVGRYYAKKVPGQTYDPLQYACQRNYTLLSTDGYWNTGSESSTYGPLKLDSSTQVGQQDGNEEKPMWDGQKDKITTATPYDTVIHQQAVYSRTYTYNVTGGTYKTWATSSCTGGKKKLSTYTGVKGVETDIATVTDLEDVTGTTTQSVVTLGGVVQSTTYSTPTASGTPSVTSSGAGAAAYSSFSMSSYTGVTTGSCTTPTTDSVTGTKTLASTTDSGSKTRTVLSQSPVGPTAGGTPTVTASSTQGGEGNTLADVAEYFYVTDLRTSALSNCTGAKGLDVCNNEVPPGDRDKASWQHMTTFTMGLGVGGTLTYDRNYLTQTSGDYNNLKQGTVSWPIPSLTGGGDPTNVDDLWHTAVNGRGQYFATTDPTSLADAITTVLTAVKKASGSSSSAATSTLRPVSGSNSMVYVAQYTTLDWTGDLIAYQMDSSAGTIDIKNPKWSVVGKIDTFSDVNPTTHVGNWTTRNVYYLQPGAATPTLRSFNYANLSSDGYLPNFTNICSKPSVPAQCADLSTAQKSVANNAANLVNYLLGDRTYEHYVDTSVTPNQNVALYRNRPHLLGDIINAAPVYVGKPPLHYADAGYAEFVEAKADRKPMVYVASNDGMLHAISGDADTGGSEVWAYIPSFVMKNLYALADTGYGNNHRYYVDGSPNVGDIKVNGVWKTILVGGLGAGGNGYYALDITDPNNPKALWEFTDVNMGYSYGQPIITKRADGTWVVVFTSGYNNTAGDGNGHLYVVNANTGVSVLSSDIATYSGGLPVGTPSSPSGLSRLNAWVDDVSDNTAKRYYAGDLLGNLWRFDIDGLVEPKKSAMLLASFASGGQPQSIMARPETAEITYNDDKIAVVLVGTGRYLGTSDIVDKTTQSVYAIKDELKSTGWGKVPGRSDLVMQTLTDSTVSSGANVGAKIRTSTTKPVNWATNIGWGVDLISSGERVAVDMALQYTTLAVVSAIPGVDECHPSGGSSWLYNFSLMNGAAPSSADGVVGSFLGDFLGVGLTWVELPDGSSRLIIPGSDGSLVSKTPATESDGTSSGTAHTTSWRELF